MEIISRYRELSKDLHNDTLNWVNSIFDSSCSGRLAIIGFSEPQIEETVANLSPDLITYNKEYDYLMIIDIKTCRTIDLPEIPFNVEEFILQFPDIIAKYSKENVIEEIMNKFGLILHKPKIIDSVIAIPKYCFERFQEFNNIEKILNSAGSSSDFCIWCVNEYDQIKIVMGSHKDNEIDELLKKGIQLDKIYPQSLFYTLKSDKKTVAKEFLKILLIFSRRTGITEFTLNQMDDIIQDKNPLFKNRKTLLYHVSDVKRRTDRWSNAIRLAKENDIMIYDEKTERYCWKHLDSSSQSKKYSIELKKIEELNE